MSPTTACTSPWPTPAGPKSVWGKIYGQWLAGSAVFVYDYDKFVPAELLKVIARHGVTTFCAPPTMYRYLIKEDLSATTCPALDYASMAGEPLNPEVYNQFRATGHQDAWKATARPRCTVAIALSLDGAQARLHGQALARATRSTCSTTRADPARWARWARSCCITGGRHPVGMFDGYYRDPELTAAPGTTASTIPATSPGGTRTATTGSSGRNDDVIKSSGYRVGPFEVESALLEHPAVLECAVTAVPDPMRGQVVKATVVLPQGYTPGEALVAELQDHVKKVTAPYKYPRIIEFVERTAQNHQRQDPPGRDPRKGPGGLKPQHAIRGLGRITGPRFGGVPWAPPREGPMGRSRRNARRGAILPMRRAPSAAADGAPGCLARRGVRSGGLGPLDPDDPA